MASSSTASTPGGQVQRLGHRPTLTVWDAIAQSLSIGPIFSSAFVAFLIAGAAGGAAPLSTLIGAIGVLALGWLIALYARRGGGAGAIYDYLRRISPAFGLFAAGIYFFGTLTLDSAGFLVIGLLGAQVFATYLNLSVPFWVFGLVALVLIVSLNYLGIRLTTRVQLILSALSAIPLLILALVIVAHGGASGNTLQAFNPVNVPAVPTSVPAAGIFPGILFAITLFIDHRCLLPASDLRFGYRLWTGKQREVGLRSGPARHAGDPLRRLVAGGPGGYRGPVRRVGRDVCLYGNDLARHVRARPAPIAGLSAGTYQFALPHPAWGYRRGGSDRAAGPGHRLDRHRERPHERAHRLRYHEHDREPADRADLHRALPCSG